MEPVTAKGFQHPIIGVTPGLDDARRVFAIKFPTGFHCRICNGVKCYPLGHRGGSWQCADCGHQETVRTGTIMQGSKITVTVWLRALELMRDTKGSATIKELHWHSGAKSYSSARILHIKISKAIGQISKDIANPEDVLHKLLLLVPGQDTASSAS